MNAMNNGTESRLESFAAGAQETVQSAQQWARRNGYGHVVRWLRGEPLGHPAHPALVDAAGGYWMASITLDMLAAVGFRSFGRASDAMLALGLISSAPSIAAGAVEFSALPERSRSAGLVHGAMAASATALYAISFFLRVFRHRHAAFFTSAAASAIAIAAAHRGGKLVFEDGAGASRNHTGALEPITLPFAAPPAAHSR